jgi:putative transposase
LLWYWEHTIPDAADFGAHVEYVNFNAVKHGLADQARDFPYSSFHRAVTRGKYPADWGGGAQPDGEMGERDDAAA